MDFLWFKEVIADYLSLAQNGFEFYLSEYPVALPLFLFVVVACLILMTCKVRHSTPSQIKADIKRELRNKVEDVKDFVGVGDRPRFRKRDKIYFYSRKIMRRMSVSFHDGPKLKAKKIAGKLARKLLGKGDRDTLQLQVVEPPPEYLMEDVRIGHSQLPLEFMNMIKNIKLFGHFDTQMFVELCKSLTTINLKTGQTLFSVGDSDDTVYMVQSGRVVVSVTEVEGGTSRFLKEAKAGETILSLLSFCDVLTGHKQPYKTISAHALEPSVVMKFPVEAVQSIFQQQPTMFVRVVQIVMARLMRVTFTALHHYLGLSSELISRVPRRSSQTAMSSPNRTKVDTTLTPDSDASPLLSSTADPLLMPSSATSSVADSEVFKHRDSLPPAGKSKRIVLVDPQQDNDEDMLEIAVTKLQRLLQLPSDELLKGTVELRKIEADDFIMKQDCCHDIALVYVLTGSLIVSQHMDDFLSSSWDMPKNDSHKHTGYSGTSLRRSESEGKEVHMFTAHPGDLVGGLAVLSGDPSFFTVKASHNSFVATIRKDTFYRILHSHPKTALHVANTVIARMSSFVRQIDFALDWEHLEAGSALYRQGDVSDSTFIVLSGRLRSVITHSDGRKEVVTDYGKGELVGIVELLTDSKRSTTVMAVRDSELARLPDGLFNVIQYKHPVVMTRLIKLLGNRLMGTWRSSVSKQPLGISLQQTGQKVGSFSTVAILPISGDTPITQFTLELFHALNSIGATARLTSEFVVRSLGTSIWEAGNEHQLISYLGQMEDQHQITLYQCDSSLTVWTHRCIRQADVILTVGLATNSPETGKLEHHVEQVARRTQKILVLLHKEDGPSPKGTVKWLNARSYCHGHYHIKAPHRVFTHRTAAKILEYYRTKVFPTTPNVHNDFSRLARVLTGTSVGLVLGGGGARGAAHLGMIKALGEAGVPIDMVAGVSIGALFGALYCLENDVARATQKARQWSMKMTSKMRMVFELTYPIVSLFSGSGFNKLIEDALGDTSIEDLWLPYFTLTTDVTDSSCRVHTHGSTWRYVRASMSLSGYMPPLCDPTDGHLLMDGGYVNNLPGTLWRYVRASMSIATYLPPMPDPVDGHLLLDGCYVNNVPADEMRDRWKVGSILAIDVGSTFDSNFTNYGDWLSGFDLLLRRTFPFSLFYTKEIRVPNMHDIQSRLSYVSCVRQLEELKASDYCEYIRPPIDKVQTLQFNLFDEVKDIGYQHGKTYFSGMSKSGRTVEEIYKLSRPPASQPPNVSLLNPSPVGYTDLAQMVICQNDVKSTVNKNNSDIEYESSTEEELNSGYNSEPGTQSFDSNSYLDNIKLWRTGSLGDNDILELVNEENLPELPGGIIQEETTSLDSDQYPHTD